MAEVNNQQKITVEIPTERGNFAPLSTTPQQPSKLDLFRRGWVNAIALPDNLPDLAFHLAAHITIPALFSSCWVNIPFPGFIRLGVLGVLAIAGIVALYLRQAVPEVKDILLLRVGLIAVGVLLGI
ncbi:MAG: hypothetical protein RM368_33025 [Nostoc sp. DedSLP03]|uniref:hypothetical protein n=1 Tax=Nostoc sp. DedSLP03 TaxID=3075400 RepID=UPI002AD422C9|nr:hypothetical protein [Nostoc sp. DedSLP03]MDZ7969714.1 hypothetical protein [Nostoc sp. DedSLP03]